MSRLSLQIHDHTKAELIQAYWAQSEDGKWQHSASELERTFGLPKGRTHAVIAKACIAHSLDHTCTGCNAATEVRSRVHLDRLSKEFRYRGSSKTNCRLCDACLLKEYAMEQTRRSQAKAEKERLIISYLAEVEMNRPQLDYCSMSLRHAFLLDGLLRYAGDSWRGEHLDSWALSRHILCGLESDTRAVFSELRLAGWLCPSANSQLEGFDIGTAGEVVFDELQVGWMVARDATGRPYSALLEIAAAVQRAASSEELRALWEWVCLCELRAHFAFCQKRLNFGGPGWTTGIETALKNLLEDCSLGQAKHLIWRCQKSLIVELQKRTRPAGHVYNMLPGNFQRTFDYYRGRGWTLDPWLRSSQTSEAIYVGHLFDRVLGGGHILIDKMTRRDFLPSPAPHGST